MPMIDTAKIKPASDAVQEALGAVRNAGSELFHLEKDVPRDNAKIEAAETALNEARGLYMTELFNLSNKVHTAVKLAEAAEG